MKRVFALLCVLAAVEASAQVGTAPGVIVKDEGTTQGRARSIDFVGSTVSCGISGGAGTCTFTAPTVTPATLKDATYCPDVGASDAYVCSMVSAPSSYAAGMLVTLSANTANTGTASVNVNSLGVKTITRADGSTLATGDIIAAMPVALEYDGTNFRLHSSPAQIAALNNGNPTLLNSFFGVGAGVSHSSGFQNVGVGYQALAAADSLYNVAVGYKALYSIGGTGNLNTAVGHQAGKFVSTGDENTILGEDAGYYVTTGSSNTIVGMTGGWSIGSGSDNTVIGANVTGLPDALQENVILADGNGAMRFRAVPSFNLTDNTIATFAVLTLGNDTGGGGLVQYEVFAADATTNALETGLILFGGTDATAGAGGEVCGNPTTIGTPKQDLNGSTLTVTFAETTGTDSCNIRVTADTNIATPTALWIRWTALNGGRTLTPQ